MSLAKRPFMIVGLAATLAVVASAASVSAQDKPAEAPVAEARREAPVELPHVDFPSLDGKTTLITHLFRPPGDEPRPAVVMMHGCSGLLAKNGRFFPLYRAWAREFLQQGYVVLVVDSAKSRGFGQTCSASEARKVMWRDRPKDAYAALRYLQAQPVVRPDRIALVGWSQGGGVVLLTISDKSIGRPAGLASDFAAAVAFYPGACAEKFQTQPFTNVSPQGWTTHVPLLVLFGEDDVWTELGPCEAFLSAAKARGNAVELKSYANAVHAFDAPGLPRIELPQYRERDGRIPVIGTDKEARGDALARVPAYLAARFGK
ncbi:dienelactone hydrolase [Bradyrhizobium sp. AZCC 1678]|uniref:dienelactone hydrolase family protein n=1 Tax=Bradyrhizobium sp. AZCC 1678 TaxID=3117030 RepID=UPI002FF363DC